MAKSDASEEGSIPPAEQQLDGHAFIIRQLKRPEEVDLLAKVYKRKFVQVSVTLDRDARIKNQKNRLAREKPELSPDQCLIEARKLVDADQTEDDDHGQRVSEIFHLGDVFISGKNTSSIEKTVDRFIQSYFGKNGIGPNKDEFGAYFAKAASLRSIDLSRQVGAAILSKEGDIIAAGCNEVPKYGGGNYWDDDEFKARDFERQTESNRVETQRIIYDFIKTLHISKLITSNRTVDEIFADADLTDSLRNALVTDITEYGRMTHAEMSAICDAARLGRSTKGATMYVTTFPCHNCAKHIVASGIDRVVYIEPYQKSRAAHSHEDSISLTPSKDGTVIFDHFEGISPRRFRDIFEKGKRRKADGTISEWYEGYPIPRVDDRDATHVSREPHAISLLDRSSGPTPDRQSPPPAPPPAP